MRKLLLILLFLTSLTAADDTAKLLSLYNNGLYGKACNLGFSLFNKNRKDESFISLYAYSCLNSDQLDRLATPIVMLKLTPEGRKNAAYLAAIFMKKKLLRHMLADGYDLRGIRLPASSHILSTVFDLLTLFDGKAQNGIYTLKDPADTRCVYRVYLERKAYLPKIVIEKYTDGLLKEQHQYK